MSETSYNYVTNLKQNSGAETPLPLSMIAAGGLTMALHHSTPTDSANSSLAQETSELDSFGIDIAYRACAAELRAQYLGQYNKYLRQYLDRAHQIAADPSVLGSWDRQIVLAQHHEGKHVRMIYRPILLDNDLDVLNESINLARAELSRRDELLWQLEGAEFASHNPRPGFVYLVGLSNDLNLYKIGITTDPKRRLKDFDATKLPFEVYFEALIATQDMHGVERSLHQRYAACRVRGEWFALTPEDVEYIKGLAT